jgi:type IV pilus assembly protein PilA
LIGTIVITRITRALKSRRNELGANEKGFTLIELLVVVIIIGILAAIAIPVYMGIQNNAKDSAVKSDVGNYKTAVVAYQTEKGTLPTPTTDLKSYGYSAPATDNYKAATLPVLTTTTTGFSICATSVTDKTFGTDDKQGVAEGTCATGVFTPKA